MGTHHSKHTHTHTHTHAPPHARTHTTARTHARTPHTHHDGDSHANNHDHDHDRGTRLQETLLGPRAVALAATSALDRAGRVDVLPRLLLRGRGLCHHRCRHAHGLRVLQVRSLPPSARRLPRHLT